MMNEAEFRAWCARWHVTVQVEYKGTRTFEHQMTSGRPFRDNQRIWQIVIRSENEAGKGAYVAEQFYTGSGIGSDEIDRLYLDTIVFDEEFLIDCSTWEEFAIKAGYDEEDPDEAALARRQWQALRNQRDGLIHTIGLDAYEELVYGAGDD